MMPTNNRAAGLKELAAMTGPCVSVVCPLDHLAPGNPHDAQTLEELRADAERQIESGVDDPVAAKQVLGNLAEAFGMIDPAHPNEGVALFAGTDLARVVPLHVSVKPRIVMGDRFAVAELASDTANATSARVLVLSLARTRCIDMTGNLACERQDAGFPIEIEAPAREETPHRDFPLDEHDHAERAHFVFRAVDTALKPVNDADPRPLVLIGAERDLSYWDEVSKSSAPVIGRVHGNYEWAGPSEIAALAAPALEMHRQEHQQAAVDEVREKLTSGAACGIADVWAAARAGRGHRLVIEEGYHFNGRFDGEDLAAAALEASDAFDAVDDALREQVGHDGEVEVVGEGMLADFGRIAMVLRY